MYPEPKQVTCECNAGFYGDGITVCDPIDSQRQSPEGDNSHNNSLGISQKKNYFQSAQILQTV